MGWTSSPHWTTPTVLKQDIVNEIDTERYTIVGWTGNWLKVIRRRDDRPFVTLFMIHSFRRREYGYKDVDSSSGPFQVSQSAAKWLRRELEKRNMAPANDWEASWLLRCGRAARRDAAIKALKPGDRIRCVESFDCTDGSSFKAGTEFIFRYKTAQKLHVARADGYGGYRLDKSLFFPLEMDDYPLMVVA